MAELATYVAFIGIFVAAATLAGIHLSSRLFKHFETERNQILANAKGKYAVKKKWDVDSLYYLFSQFREVEEIELSVTGRVTRMLGSCLVGCISAFGGCVESIFHIVPLVILPEVIGLLDITLILSLAFLFVSLFPSLLELAKPQPLLPQ